MTDDDGRTHWDGCWEHHFECAQVKIADIEAELNEARKDTERLDWCDEHVREAYAIGTGSRWGIRVIGVDREPRGDGLRAAIDAARREGGDAASS